MDLWICQEMFGSGLQIATLIQATIAPERFGEQVEVGVGTTALKDVVYLLATGFGTVPAAMYLVYAYPDPAPWPLIYAVQTSRGRAPATTYSKSRTRSNSDTGALNSRRPQHKQSSRLTESSNRAKQCYSTLGGFRSAHTSSR